MLAMGSIQLMLLRFWIFLFLLILADLFRLRFFLKATLMLLEKKKA